MKAKDCVKIWQVLEVVQKRVKRPSAYEYGDVGICYAFSDTLEAVADENYSGIYSVWRQHRTDAFEAWGDYSGDHLYPIKGSARDPVGTYHYASLDSTMWDRRTEYGRARRLLLEHCIAWFKARDL